MSTTDQVLMNEMQYALLETPNSGASISSGVWTPQEVLDALNECQSRLLKDTMVVLKADTINPIPHVTRHPLPSDCIAIHQVLWEDADAVWWEVARGDIYEADALEVLWEQPNLHQRPQTYSDTDVPQLQLMTSPSVQGPGQIEVLYAYVGAVLNGSGIAVTVPDELTPALRWGAVGILLSKIGRGQDLARAAYAESRYQEGAAAARLLLEGMGG